VDDLRRNQWPTFSGIGGRFGPESVVDLGRIMQKGDDAKLQGLQLSNQP